MQSEQSPDVWADDKCLFSIQEVFLRSPEGQTRCMRSSKGGKKFQLYRTATTGGTSLIMLITVAVMVTIGGH